MKTFVLASLVLLTTPAFAQQSVPAIQFDSVPDYPNLPKGMNLGEVPGVAVNSKGHVYVFTRSNSANGPAYAPAAAQLLEFDNKGDYVGEIGKGLYAWAFAHTVRIDKDDNVYVGDRANRRVQVFDTDGNFKRMFTVDVPPEPGTVATNGNTPTGARLAQAIGAPNSLCIPPGANPNQVLFLGESTFPGRIFKLTLEGKVLGVIGRSGRNLKEFSGGHQLACPSENELYVAESSNWRVQKLLLKAQTN